MPKPRPLKGLRYATGDAEKTVRNGLLGMIEFLLPYLDFGQAMVWYGKYLPTMSDAERRILACNDRFYLLARLCHRRDTLNQWVYERCREVEADPDDHLDLWARYHYKTSIITFAGTMQEILIDPEITIGIFSNTLAISRPFLAQIKREFETNDELKALFPDILWQNPQREAPLWSLDKGIVVKRQGNPPEATVEAHGLIDALPTGRHFRLLKYDDIINEHSVSNPEQIKKATERWELSDNLGVGELTRKQYAGTRYHFGDTYGIMIEREVVKPRLHPATHDGKITGRPVFLSPEGWEKVKKTQRSQIAAQMLLNPRAGEENTFLLEWLRPYDVRPLLMNVYILADPSKGTRPSSDRTAIAVIGIDVLSNRYFLDGYCHRMTLSQRWDAIKNLHRKWSAERGIQMVRIGYERYGMQTDLEYFEEQMLREKITGMSIEEVAWVREGGQSKTNRVERLEPYFRNSQMWMMPKVWHPDHGGICTWEVKEGDSKITYYPYRGPADTGSERVMQLSKAERDIIGRSEHYRIMQPVRRRDEDNNIYDVFRVFAEEYSFFPFSPRDDLIDATSRIEDMDATPAQVIEQGALDMPETVD